MGFLLPLAALNFAPESHRAPGFHDLVPTPQEPEKRFPFPFSGHRRKISWRSTGPPDSPALPRRISAERNRKDFLHPRAAAKNQRPRSRFAIWRRTPPIVFRSMPPERRVPSGDG